MVLATEYATHNNNNEYDANCRKNDEKSEDQVLQQFNVAVWIILKVNNKHYTKTTKRHIKDKQKTYTTI